MNINWLTMRIIQKQRAKDAHEEANEDRNRRIALFNLDLPFINRKKTRDR